MPPSLRIFAAAFRPARGTVLMRGGWVSGLMKLSLVYEERLLLTDVGL